MTKLKWLARTERLKRHLQLKVTGLRPCTARELNHASRVLNALMLTPPGPMSRDDIIVLANLPDRLNGDYVAYL